MGAIVHVSGKIYKKNCDAFYYICLRVIELNAPLALKSNREEFEPMIKGLFDHPLTINLMYKC